MARQAAKVQIRQQSSREGQGWGGLQGVNNSKASKKAELPSLQPGALLVTSLCYQPTFATFALVSQAWPLKYSLLHGFFAICCVQDQPELN